MFTTTYFGGRVYFGDIFAGRYETCKPDIRDIARALSRMPRFNGHTTFPWSVAQHSALVSTAVPPAYCRAALLHDASEAYIADLPRDVKHTALLSGYRVAERHFMQWIGHHFRIPMSHFESPVIKDADNRALVTEALELLTDYEWVFEPRWCDVYPMKTRLVERPPGEVEQGFLGIWELYP